MIVSQMRILSKSKSINHSVSPWWRGSALHHSLHGMEVSQLSITVEVRKGNLEQAMRVLKRKIQKEGIIKELRMRQYYEKPSEKLRRKKKENIANVKKRMKKLARIRGY